MLRSHVHIYITSFMLLGILDAAMNPGSIFGLQISDRPTASVTATELSEAELLGLESKGDDELFGYNFDFDFDLDGVTRAGATQEYVPELLGYVPLPSIRQPAIGGAHVNPEDTEPTSSRWSWGGDSGASNASSDNGHTTKPGNIGDGNNRGDGGGITPEPTSAPEPTPAPTSEPTPEPSSKPKPELIGPPIVITIAPPAPPLTDTPKPEPTVEPVPGNSSGGNVETVIMPGYPGEIVVEGVRI